jgi:hypothetical protein
MWRRTNPSCCAAAHDEPAGMHLAEVGVCAMPLSGMVHTLQIFCEFVT